MATINNLKLPASWTTVLPNDDNFDISANKLGDFLEAFDPIDWAGLNFDNVGLINGIDISQIGGGLDFTAEYLLRDDFEWSDVSGAIASEKYEVSSGAIDVVGQTLGSTYGVIQLDPGSVFAGDAAELFSSAFSVDTGKGNIFGKWGIAVNDTTNSMVVVAVASSATGGGETTQAGWFSSVDDAFGFVFDPATSANWQIFSNNGGTTTVNDSGIAVTSSFVKLEARFYDSIPSIQYKIDGSIVGTITTNIPPSTDLFMYAGIFNKIAQNVILDMDYWELTGPRIH